MVGAAAVGKVRIIQPFLIFGAVLACAGAGLIYMFDIGTPSKEFIGYQIVAGIGIGLAIQVPVITAQALSDPKESSMAMSTILFFQFLGSAVGVASAQSIFNNRLANSLSTSEFDVDMNKVFAVGAYGLREAFPDRVELMNILRAYVIGLRSAWALGIALSGVSLLAALGPRWERLPKR